MARKQGRKGQGRGEPGRGTRGRGPGKAARRGRRASRPSARLRWLGALLLLAIIGVGWGWWVKCHWQPPRGQYPQQGVEIGLGMDDVDWTAIRAVGADFAYLDASAGAFARDPAFMSNFEAARAAGLSLGAVHRYDPCQPADKQAANFVTVVPRDPAMLPAAVDLSALGDDCPQPVSDGAVVSELMTFLNQIETHTGKSAILKISPGFESRYHIAHAINRNLWLTQEIIAPDYAGEPFTLWTANSSLYTPAGDKPLRWVVVGR